ncbi:monocarboxylate transporter 2 [Nilaparvata lugens]|uniref:monocarboxylate transporter 2 n=1 Tax=Nilaparvata lugens TaxID=108931 RepID=UPI00193EA9AA|nr:monocarboxylate transporter 2 [Nilaparvata lugens]
MQGMSSAFKQVMDEEEENKKNTKYHPPDGGWGWVIVASFAAQNIILLPIIINFGLMFRDIFAVLEMSQTDVSIIININSAAGMLFGLMNGPILKTFGFRKTACTGAVITFLGNLINFFPFPTCRNNHCISAIGIALVMSSFSLALNSYFVKRRGMATGIAMSATGLGPVFMPLLISFLMGVYGARGTAFIMAALTLHSFVGSLLLQPVKWHYKTTSIEQGNSRVDSYRLQTCDIRRTPSILAQSRVVWMDVWSLASSEHSCSLFFRSGSNIKMDEYSAKATSTSIRLDLLSEPVFFNIWIGMSLEFTSEMNFALMVPFILKDWGYDTKKTAQLMSIMAVADVCTRLVAPIIGRKTKIPARYLYLISVVVLIGLKFSLVVAESERTRLLVFIALGIGRGFRALYRALVVPNHVPIEKLASASGLQTALNGVFLITFGPVLGYIKDVMKSYSWYLTVLNILAALTVVLWLCEILIRICKHRKTTANNDNNAP